MSTKTQGSLQRAAERARAARVALDAEIVAAHAAGVSLREIASAAGVSHEQVRRIVKAATS